MFNPISKQTQSVLALATLTALLTACDDNKTTATPPASTELPAAESSTPATAEAQPAATTATPAAAPAATAPQKESGKDKAQKALIKQFTSDTFSTLSQYAAQPAFTESVRNTLQALQDYYDSMAEEQASEERIQILLSIAETCRDLTAYARAESNYKLALEDCLALPDLFRQTEEMQMTMSSIYNGIASCMLNNIATVKEAGAYYDKQIAIDEALFKAKLPSEETEITDEILNAGLGSAAANIISSYRCKGDGLVVTDELEDARDAYKKGASVVEKLKKLTPEMSLEYIKLLTALGNLESRCSNNKEALAAWVLSAQLCKKINEGSNNPKVKFETKRYFDRLKPLIEESSAALKTDEQKAEEEEAELLNS